MEARSVQNYSNIFAIATFLIKPLCIVNDYVIFFSGTR